MKKEERYFNVTQGSLSIRPKKVDSIENIEWMIENGIAREITLAKTMYKAPWGSANYRMSYSGVFSQINNNHDTSD